MPTIRKIKIVADEENEKAKEGRDALYLEFRKREVRIISYPDPKDIQLVVVLGGDGTMLKTVHSYDFRPAFLGINYGHKGYLMNEGEVSEVADRILDEKFEIHRFPLLNIEGDGWKGLAMGDVYFNRITGQTCKVNVKVDGVEIAPRISGDGIVVCTALGANGYFVPAGGSAVHPKLPIIGFAPIIRNMPFQIIPMIFPLQSEFEVTLLSPPEEVKGWYDGEFELPYFQKIKIKKSKRKVKLVFWEGEDFTERLVRKIMKVQEV